MEELAVEATGIRKSSRRSPVAAYASASSSRLISFGSMASIQRIELARNRGGVLIPKGKRSTRPALVRVLRRLLRSAKTPPM